MNADNVGDGPSVASWSIAREPEIVNARPITQDPTDSNEHSVAPYVNLPPPDDRPPVTPTQVNVPAWQSPSETRSSILRVGDSVRETPEAAKLSSSSGSSVGEEVAPSMNGEGKPLVKPEGDMCNQSSGESSFADPPIHCDCKLFPELKGEDMKNLADNIKSNGLTHPIVLHQGEVVDGQNRLIACRIANVKPRFVKWSDVYGGPMALADWMWSVNGERRHLTEDQVVMIKALLDASRLREEARRAQDDARRRQGEHGSEGGRGNKKPLRADAGNKQQSRRSKQSRDTRSRLAATTHVSEHKAQMALDVAAGSRTAAEEVARGEKKLSDAAKQVRKNRPRRKNTDRQNSKAHVESEQQRLSDNAPLFSVSDAVNELTPIIDSQLERAGNHRAELLAALIEMLKSRI